MCALSVSAAALGIIWIHRKNCEKEQNKKKRRKKCLPNINSANSIVKSLIITMANDRATAIVQRPYHRTMQNARSCNFIRQNLHQSDQVSYFHRPTISSKFKERTNKIKINRIM